HRQAARDAMARAQVKQAEAYDVGRRPLSFEEGDEVLLNPHTLEWVESKGTGRKLVQHTLGPFAIAERVGDNTYRLLMDDKYPGSRVFN
ncbi:hypothetical protein PENSPDRAFT_548183, partial [Peniophora sp. CONT]